MSHTPVPLINEEIVPATFMRFASGEDATNDLNIQITLPDDGDGIVTVNSARAGTIMSLSVESFSQVAELFATAQARVSQAIVTEEEAAASHAS